MKFTTLLSATLICSGSLLLAPIFNIHTAHVYAQKSKKTEKAESKINESTLAGLQFRSIGTAFISGRIIGIAVQPDNPSIQYVAAASGGVWKTVNAGISWEPIFENEGSYSIGCVTIDPANPHRIWVGTGELNSQRSVGFGDGVYRSDDGGKSWQNMGLKSSEHIARVIVHPKNSDVVFVAAQGPLWSAGGERGLYKSDNAGKTWTQILPNADIKLNEHTGVTDLVLDPRNPDIMYAATYQHRRHVWSLIDGGPESALYKSTDGGKTWTKCGGGLPNGEIGRIGLAIAPSNPDILYAQVEAANGKGGTYRSTNRGATWEKRNSFDATAMYYSHIFVDPKNADKFYLMNTYTMTSNDGGKTLKNIPDKNKHVDTHYYWIDPNNSNHILAGCDGGLYETFDGCQSWRWSSHLPIAQFYRVSVDNAEPFYNVYGGTQDNFSLGGPSQTRSSNGIMNSDWFITQGGDGFKSQIDPNDPNIVYAQYQNGGLCRFDRRTGENTGIKPAEPKGEPQLRYNWDAPLIISPHSPTRLYFGANKLFRSDNRGDSWKAISGDLTRQIDRNTLPMMGKVQSMDAVAKNASTALYGNLSQIAESPKKEGLLAIGTDDGLIQISTNGGESWTKIESVVGVPDRAYVAALLWSQHDEQTLYAAFDNHKMGDFKPYLFRSTDAGRSWTNISANLPERGMTLAIAEDHETPNLLFVGTEFGVFTSLNRGDSWIKLTGNLPTIPVRDLAIQKRENDLAIATFGRGFYILDNYSPLRQMTEEVAAKEAALFPIKTAKVYIQTTPLGGGDKGHFGETHFTAPNPAFGATFTLYLKDSYKTKKQLRQKAEADLMRDGKDIPVPSLDALRAEAEEETPSIVCTITDAEGNVLRRLKAANSPGIQRVTWNLKMTDPNPAGQTNGDDDFGGGPLVMPGEYFVAVSKRVEGKLTEIIPPTKFLVEELGGATLPAKDKKGLVAFQKKVAKLHRAVTGTVDAANGFMQKIGLLKLSAFESPKNLTATDEQIRQTETTLRQVLIALRGDNALRSRNENTPASIQDRLFGIWEGGWLSRSAPTSAQMDNYAIAGEELATQIAKLRDIESQIQQIEKSLEQAEAPSTPGRIPVWKPE